ncbi:class I SAM-dependent methyltransferase [Aldersonia sp. NBC_00410]|uniref:class I SAM-dependent methyltransferase n=1 Tax=Aldersonia sp. NBC_00410 TaxID=2975954 RepID=UPI002255E0BD|nr:class I SAM-dependent methyltransferase [Aldersonia sp. NBC_00410]MCX5041817.1 class I SAM-dependent methyltransferase [Aldersonia sp. NBC_00410]
MPQSEFAAVFNAGRDSFIRNTPLIWGPTGQALAYQLQLRPGETVLDFCCGAGSSAIPAAMAVGPTGRVHGIDLADDLLEEGRLVASQRALQNVDFVATDATLWEPPSSVPDAGYDALSSSYGVFFLPDMDRAVHRLLGLLRPGGRFGVSVWRSGSLSAFTGPYFEVLGRYSDEEPARRTVDAGAARDRATKLDTIEHLTEWLTRIGGSAVTVRELSAFVPATEQVCWDMVAGSALRGTLAKFDGETVARIRDDYLSLLVERDVHTIDLGTLIGTATIG